MRSHPISVCALTTLWHVRRVLAAQDGPTSHTQLEPVSTLVFKCVRECDVDSNDLTGL